MTNQNTTPPVDHKAVNQWMVANDWKWMELGHPLLSHWQKDGFHGVNQDLAAEMYRMVEAAVAAERTKL